MLIPNKAKRQLIILQVKKLCHVTFYTLRSLMHNFIAIPHHITNTFFRIQFIILAELSH